MRRRCFLDFKDNIEKKDALSAQEVISGRRRHGYAQPRLEQAVQLKLFVDLIEQYFVQRLKCIDFSELCALMGSPRHCCLGCKAALGG
jgi:hypothetical protein